MGNWYDEQQVRVLKEEQLQLEHERPQRVLQQEQLQPVQQQLEQCVWEHQGRQLSITACIM